MPMERRRRRQTAAAAAVDFVFGCCRSEDKQNTRITQKRARVLDGEWECERHAQVNQYNLSKIFLRWILCGNILKHLFSC